MPLLLRLPSDFSGIAQEFLSLIDVGINFLEEICRAAFFSFQLEPFHVQGQLLFFVMFFNVAKRHRREDSFKAVNLQMRSD